MSSQKELRALITLAGKIDPSLQNALAKASGETRGLSESLKQSSKGLGSFKSMVGASFIGNVAANAITRLTSEISQLAVSSVDYASDIKEVQNVVDTTFKDSSVQINEFAKTALNAYGLSELQAKQYAGTMGAMLKSSGITQDDMVIMSTKLAGLAGEFASFYNLDHDDAWEKIRAGMSGETEPLRQLGINMSVANLEAYAMSQGITKAYKDMSQGEQTLLRYNYLLNNSADAQGDFAKTSGEYANQQRLFETNLKKTAATLAAEFLPYFNDLLKKGNEFLASADIASVADDIKNSLQFLGDAIKFTKDNADILIPVIGGLTAAMIVNRIATSELITAQKLGLIMDALTKAWGYGQLALMMLQNGTSLATIAQIGFNAALSANPIGMVVVGVGLLVGAGIALYRNWESVSQFFVSSWDWIKESAANGVNFVIDKINWLIEKINAIPGIEIPTIGHVGYRTSEDNAKYSASVAKSMDMYAEGGIATKASIFGEEGPEMAIPLRKTPRSIALLNQTSQLLGVGSGKHLSVAIHVDASNSEGNAITSNIKKVVKEVIEDFFGDEERVSFG